MAHAPSIRTPDNHALVAEKPSLPAEMAGKSLTRPRCEPVSLYRHEDCVNDLLTGLVRAVQTPAGICFSLGERRMDRKETLECLIRAAQAGEPTARNELLRQYRPQLLRMIHCQLDPRLQARLDDSDIAQESLTVANRDLSRYRSQPCVPFYAWLRKLAWRQVLRTSERHIKTGKRTVLKERRLQGDAADPICLEKLANLSTPSKAAMRGELYEELQAALNALSATDREVVELRFLRQLNAKAVAAAIGISEAAASKRLTRALRRLAKQMEPPCGPLKKGMAEGETPVTGADEVGG